MNSCEVRKGCMVIRTESRGEEEEKRSNIGGEKKKVRRGRREKRQTARGTKEKETAASYLNYEITANFSGFSSYSH